MPPEPGLARAGETALPSDSRFRFAWRMPPSGRPDRPLLIAVHGSDRNWLACREAFVPLADRCDISLLAPLFPEGVSTPGMADGYKFLREPDVDYIALLHAMLAAFAEISPFDSRRLFLFGFSGGAQFAHRYALVEATRLAGLVVAAPGNVTLVDDTLPWWAGTKDMDRALGRPLDRAGLGRLPVHLIVGSKDFSEGLVERGPDDPYYSPHSQLGGATRWERIASLARSLKSVAGNVSEETVEGAGHDFAPLAAAAATWLERMIRD